MTSKLNNLLQTWPNGSLMSVRRLKKLGFTDSHIQRYRNSGWLKQVAKGVYLKLDEPLTFEAALNMFQKQLELPLHLGGLSALEQHGLAHYVPMANNRNQKWLFNTTGKQVRLPRWFEEHFADVTYISKHLFKTNCGLMELTINGIPLIISTPERAILETLSVVGKHISYEHASQLTENLQLLRSTQLNELLLSNNSKINLKLFLHLADYHQLPCFKKIEVNTLDLGKGISIVDKNGSFDEKYNIVVPKLNNENEEGIGYV